MRRARWHVASSEAPRLRLSSHALEKLKRALWRLPDVEREFNKRQAACGNTDHGKEAP